MAAFDTSHEGQSPLDAFCALTRPGRLAAESEGKSRSAYLRGVAPGVVEFARTWGPWDACSCGHRHPAPGPALLDKYRLPWTDHPLAGVSEWPPAVRSLFANEEKGLRDALRLSRVILQAVDALLDCARRVNALRAMIAALRAEEPTVDEQDWRLLTWMSEGWTVNEDGKQVITRSPDPLPAEDYAADERFGVAYLRRTVDEIARGWLQATHVGLGIARRDGRPTGQFVVGGVAGALAVVMWDDLVQDRPLRVCKRCRVTWSPQRPSRRGVKDERALCRPCRDWADQRRSKEVRDGAPR